MGDELAQPHSGCPAGVDGVVGLPDLASEGEVMERRVLKFIRDFLESHLRWWSDSGAARRVLKLVEKELKK